MSSNSFPFGSDTLSAPMFLVSDESDPAYIAWRSEHPDAFVAGTWTRPTPARRQTPPDTNRSRRTDIDPAATVPTRDLVARSNLSTQEFMQIAAAARAGASAPHSPERHQQRGGTRDSHRATAPTQSRPGPEDYSKQLTDAEFKQRNIDDLAAIMFDEARG